MAYSRRRLLLSAVFLILIAAIAGGPGLRLPAPTVARADNGDVNVEFDALSPVTTVPANTANPPRLLAGDRSHALPAVADLVLGTNGYCVTLHTQNLTPYSDAGIPAQNLGFSVVASNPISSATPPTLFVPLPGAVRATEPWLTSVDAPPGFPTTPTANGDKFCVVVQAPTGYKTLSVNWDYKDAGGVRHTITLNDPDLIPIVTVTLRATAVGSFGTVCTVGWDPSFLTGHASNVAVTLPDALDTVSTADWTVTLNPGQVTVVSVQHDTTNPVEWCVSLKSSAAGSIVTNVSFAFDSVYNRIINSDDQAHTITLQGTCPLTIPGGFAIAHIGAAGEVLTEEVSPALVIGAREFACILGTTNADTMQPSDISITAASGTDKPNVTALTVFHAPGTLPSGSSVAGGTLCFSWSSSTPGEQLVAANFLLNGVTSQHAQWVGTSGTDCAVPVSGFLVVQWNRIDRTAITTGATPLFSGPDENDITNTTLTYDLVFNALDGSFLVTGGITLDEFVMGSHNTGGQRVNGFLQGVQFRAQLVSQGVCGHFEVPSGAHPQQIRGISIGGRFELNDGSLDPFAPAFNDMDAAVDDLQLSIDGDPCTAGSVLQVKVDVFYPGAATPALPTPETVTINFVFYPPNKTPQVAWAGQTVTTSYAFAVSGDLTCADLHAVFVRGAKQRGSFVGGTSATVNGDSVNADFTSGGSGCASVVKYTSADPGEVDVEAFLLVNGKRSDYSKVGFPIFFLAIEDVTLTSNATQNVSDVGDVVATVRGFFVGSNPSGRPAETKPDGRRVPADRWVLPDDWDTLRGPSEFRGNWGSADLPPLNVTFLMQDETVVNSYKDKVSKGAVGWFIPDLGGNGSSPPEIGRVPDANGVYPRPRTMTAQSDYSGIASVHNFGDYNLSYEGCAANIPTGNPHCKVGDIVGHTRYVAVADYAEDPGKFPQVGSNVSPTDWTWAGFKQVTIVPGDVPYQKYVVAHLLDRDGFCDATSWNNVLGVKVAFHIDSGDGVILEAQGQPSEVSSDRQSAVVTTFDLLDDAGKAMNADIAKPTVDPGECQAWVKVSDSLMNPVNVIVTFPSQPAPIPAPVRITKLVCGDLEEVTVTNKGLVTVSLAGFALRSFPPGGQYFEEQHLGLSGFLKPGESASFAGGPSATLAAGWIPGTDYVMRDGVSDYMRLVWDNFEFNRVNCAGQFSTPPIADPLPPDQEGQIVVDQVVEFNTDFPVSLGPGWNLVTAGVGSTDIAQAFAANSGDLLGVYLWDFQANQWKRYLPGVPAGDATTALTTLEKGQIYWVAVKRAFTVTLLK